MNPSLQQIISRLGRVFTLGEIQQAYQQCFRNPAGTIYVLPDLLEFCGANDPAPSKSDLFTQGRAAGRRDVWLRIQEHLNLTPEELSALYAGRSILKKEDFQSGMVR